jgi:hypothetical protein
MVDCQLTDRDRGCEVGRSDVVADAKCLLEEAIKARQSMSGGLDETQGQRGE